jgi:hypothetical protein
MHALPKDADVTVKLDFEQRQEAEKLLEQAMLDEDALRELLYELIDLRLRADKAEREAIRLALIVATLMRHDDIPRRIKE